MQSELSDIVRFHGAPALLAGAGISIDAPSNLLSGGDMMKGIIEKAVLSNDASHFLNLLHPPYSRLIIPAGIFASNY